MEDKIPAFPLWKILNDTIIDVFKIGCEENNVKRLVSIIKSKEFESIFVFQKDATLSYEEYCKISNIYKAYTTWILGRLFYVLNQEKLLNAHDEVIDAQVYTLNQLSKLQMHSFYQLIQEYVTSIRLLMNYLKNSNDTKMILNVFEPQGIGDVALNLDLSPVLVEISSKQNCMDFVCRVLSIVKYILVENFVFQRCDNVGGVLDDLIYLLMYGTVAVKLKIFEIFIDILHACKIKNELNDYTVRCKIENIGAILETLIYEICNKKLLLGLHESERFRGTLAKFIDTALNSKYSKYNEHIAQFLIWKIVNRQDITVFIPQSVQEKLGVAIQNLKIVNDGEHIKQLMLQNIKSHNSFIVIALKNEFIREIKDYSCSSTNVEVFSEEVSWRWSSFYVLFLENFEESVCTNNCCVLETFFPFFSKIMDILLQVHQELLCCSQFHNTIFVYLKEVELFFCLIRKLNVHFGGCSKDTNIKIILECLLKFTILCQSKNLDIIFTILAHPLLKDFFYKAQRKMPSDFIGAKGNFSHSKEINRFYEYWKTQNFDRIVAMEYTGLFLKVLSLGLVRNINDYQVVYIQDSFLDVSKQIMQGSCETLKVKVFEVLPHITTLFTNREKYLEEILTPYLTTNRTVDPAIIKTFGSIICLSSSHFIKIANVEKLSNIEILCKKCHLGNKCDDLESVREWAQKKNKKSMIIVHFDKVDTSGTLGVLLNNTLRLLTMSNPETKASSVKLVPYFANHTLKVHSANIAKMWIHLIGDNNEIVRNAAAKIVFPTLKNFMETEVLSVDVKNEILQLVTDKLIKVTKTSLQDSNFDLQLSVLRIIDEVAKLRSKQILFPLARMLIYFIMVATSKHSVETRFFLLAKEYDMTPRTLYQKHAKEICEVLVHICVINQRLLNYNLNVSLYKISLILDFVKVKDFVRSECQYLLPFLVAKAVTVPKVTKLIEEMASMMDMDISELLAAKYGYIFLHLFLNQKSKEELRLGMEYLEKAAGTGRNLRRMNFRVILNNLLLNFHEKKHNVKLALVLLSREDSEDNINNIPDYIQPHFLGILQHFLATLISNGSQIDNVLKSLAELLEFMGPKHITPLRFKIISMLQTLDINNNAHLLPDVWQAFVKSCEEEVLGPHLATIFVSLLKLLDKYPEKVNSVFRYLLIDNEAYMRENVKDLFFVTHSNINAQIIMTIRKYLRPIEELNFKDKIKLFLKYLSHETIEVRIQGLKQIKLLMEKHREELDRMILGYNGIDSTLVELIDILTLGCREKDLTLKLTCGEVIGELGAVEPSHLPRRYIPNTNSFAFFIYEDNFIISALNELTKALQAEKNAVNMDRTALAIQEILKNYQISPDSSSRRHAIWAQFSEPQQELMLPLLSSKYTITHSVNSNYDCPIYNSSFGASFQSWLYNWTCSLIFTLLPEHKALLEACLPSMKEGHKVLMHFLPYVLLHSLLEGGNSSQETTYIEFQTVTNSFEDRKQLDEQILNEVVVPLYGLKPLPQNITTEKVKQIKCVKVVFVLLDFLNRWMREWQWQNGQKGMTATQYVTVKNFLGRFCKLQLAKCNYRCEEYPRALMYLEDFITENPAEITNHLTFLAEIYAQLDEPDGVDGVTALRQAEPSLEERILALQVSGKLGDATACYERINPPLKLQHIKGLMQCYLDLDNVNTALNFAEGILSREVDFGNSLLELQAEPLWRLGRYDQLDNLVNRIELKDNKSWGVQIGRALIHFKNGDRDTFKAVLDDLQMQQINSLGATSLKEGAYQHGYGYIAKLHTLNEFHQVEKTIHNISLRPNNDIAIENMVKQLRNEWELRFKVVQESVRITEPVLCLRRVALEQGKNYLKDKAPSAIPHINALIGECWLLSAKAARSARVHQQAYTYTLKAEEFATPELFLEKAKLHWLREEHEQALTTLKRGVQGILPTPSTQNIAALNIKEKQLCAEAKLLIATYNDSTSNVDTDINVQHYKEAVEVYKEWEKSLVLLGQYYDRICQNLNRDDYETKGSDMQIHIINYFGKSLLYGTSYVYQSMPRLLSIWFDYGTKMLDITGSVDREVRSKNLLKMTKLIDTYLEKLPVYIFLTAFSQILSRICHPQKEVYIELKSIIIKLLLHYPQQTLWMMIPVIKSSYSVRSKRCAEILGDPRLKTPSISKLVRDFTSLAEKLIELCNKEIPPDTPTTSVQTLLKTLPRMLTKGDFSEIMMPTHKHRKLILPNPDFKSSQHNPFPNQFVYIANIDDQVTVLQSLQRPRKIILRGSDGKGYIQMLKPKDDLRKDFRLMEFNDIVNQLLTREAEARQRRLNIRLYSVAPLNEECGLIEWIPDLVGLRPVLIKLYKQRGLGMTNRELKGSSCNIRDPLAKKREVFIKNLLPRYPPLLGEWFKKTFPDPQSWFTARTAYIRTTAVISMVGYILGLGDRHGENILFDSTSGDTVHVDFNCLFNKGESFEWPERVPFRLTQNMVAAMGPLGVEGVFRKSCACTLRVLRTNTNTLMSIVTPFVYDPLVSWPRNVPSSHAHNAERTNEQALDHIKNIELRLQGIGKTRNRSLSIPLSVEGQTNYLINEAMNIDNLCQMYIGWGPYF